MPQDKRRFKTWQLCSLFLGLGAGLIATGCSQVTQSFPAKAEQNQVSPASADTQTPQSPMKYEVNGAVVHLVVIPKALEVSVAVADDLTPLRELAQRESAVYAINAGFFDPNNGKTTSHITVQGEVVGNPASNERLVGNPNLDEYMTQILTQRSEFRAYQCKGSEALTYDIQPHDASSPEGCLSAYVIGAGPALLPADTSFAEAFTDYANDDPDNGEITRDAIGSMQRNARSAIGIDASGNVVLLMVAKDNDSVGMTLSEVAEFAKGQGIQKLLNLDGGSSSGLSASLNPGEEQAPVTYFGRADEDGNPIERPIKSVIIAK